MTTDYLIIGQGISGTMLSWYLHKEGRSFIVMDDARPASASRVAAGIINPVTGRRYVTTWMIEDVMPFAVDAYTEIGNYLGRELIRQRNIIDFFPSVQMREAFISRHNENDTYLQAFPDQNHFNQYFNYDFGCGEIAPCYQADLNLLLVEWRKKLAEKNALAEEYFDHEQLQIQDDSVQYKDIKAGRIIFCNGISSMNYPWFRLLPFAPNKGEVLLIHCEGLNTQFVFKRSLMICPAGVKDVYWVGSGYAWKFENEQPTEIFLKQTTALLNKWLKLPYRVLDHQASVRPATLERRPFVGWHPHLPVLGMLNGMGSKGTSLAPFFAHQMVQQIVHGFPVTADAGIDRFSRILSK